MYPQKKTRAVFSNFFMCVKIRSRKEDVSDRPSDDPYEECSSFPDDDDEGPSILFAAPTNKAALNLSRRSDSEALTMQSVSETLSV